MKLPHFTLIALAATFVLPIAAEAAGLKGTRPNIILVMTDDQGPHLGVMGHPILKTPHIDQFAAESLSLLDFHVSPTCSPTRAAILSGRHEFKNGVTGTIHERERMALSTTTFPQLLQQAGYQTGIFGKWHLGDPKPFRPAQRGFTETLTHGAGGIGQFYPGSCADLPTNELNKGDDRRYFDNVLLHNEQVVKTEGYCTDVFFASALAWMKQQLAAEQPFFAFITPNTPHAPMIAPEGSKQRILQRYPNFKADIQAKYPKLKADALLEYYGMIENIDDNFGLMLSNLEAWGALENTLIIFTTDNGASSRHGGTEIHNAGFKTGKGSVHEGGGHVPCFWYWKGQLQAGETAALTAHIDLYKTFCDLAGVQIPNDIQELDGRTLLPLLEDPQADWDDRALFITAGRWDLGVEPKRDSRWSVRTQRWRLVGGKLFDIANDPYEDEEVSKQHPEVVQNLTQVYRKWWETALPLMVNEKSTWEGEAPLHALYKQQQQATGIPVWTPPTF